MSRVMTLVIGVLAAVLVLMPLTAQAQMDQVLGDVTWGDSHEEIVQKLRSERLEQLRNNSRLRNDQAAMQRARQQVLDDVRRIEDSRTEMTGDNQDYSVSVIAGEFTPDNGESFLRVRDDAATRYYFFLDDEFYKLLIAYDQDHVRNLGFTAFMNQVEQRYGRAQSTERGRAGGEERVVQATWENGEVQLRIHDRKDFFGTYTMVFSDQQTVEQLLADNEEFGGGDEHVEVSERVRNVTRGVSERQNEDIVNQLIGGEIDDVALPESPSERRAREEAAEQAAEAEERAARRERERAEEEEAARARRARQNQDDSAAASSGSGSDDDDDDDGDDLVIY